MDHAKVLVADDPVIDNAVTNMNAQLVSLITAIGTPELLECDDINLAGFFDAGGPSYHFALYVAVKYQG